MGSPIRSNVEPVKTSALNTMVNKELLGKFKDDLRHKRYQMNIVLEAFMQQYSKGRFNLKDEDIMKFKTEEFEVDVLNTTFNRDIYIEFKSVCKAQGYYMKHVVQAFMEEYLTGNYALEFTKSNKE